MKKEDLKKLVMEELNDIRNQVTEEETVKPVVDPKKSVGIILGAVKTLFNSGAITGVDPMHAKDITKELIKQINVAIAPYGQAAAPQGDDLNDDSAYEEEEESLGDQSQYDPDLSKQTSDFEPKPEPEEEDEPLFEVKKLAEKLKI